VPKETDLLDHLLPSRTTFSTSLSLTAVKAALLIQETTPDAVSTEGGSSFAVKKKSLSVKVVIFMESYKFKKIDTYLILNLELYK